VPAGRARTDRTALHQIGSSKAAVAGAVRGERPLFAMHAVERAKIRSNLLVLDFDGAHAADEVLNELRSAPKEYLFECEDACVAEL